MTTTDITSYCGACGAPNYGTRFCENCGTPSPSAPSAAVHIAAPPAPPAPSAPYSGTPAPIVPAVGGGLSEPVLRNLRWGAAGLWTLLQVIFLLGVITQSYDFYYGVGLIAKVILVVGAGTLAIIAAFGGWATGGRRVAAGLSAIGFLLFGTLSYLFPFWWYLSSGPVTGFFSYLLEFLIIPGLGFASWALSRPFGGPGWLAGLALAGGGLLNAILSVVGFGATYVVMGLIGLAVIPLVIVIPWWTERHVFARVRAQRAAGPAAGSPRAAAGVVAYDPSNAGRTNTLAVLALVFGVLGSAVIPIVLGHVALSQIARSGEQGRGMAIAGIVLGWIGAAAIIVVIIIYASVIVGLGSYVSYY